MCFSCSLNLFNLRNEQRRKPASIFGFSMDKDLFIIPGMWHPLKSNFWALHKKLPLFWRLCYFWPKISFPFRNPTTSAFRRCKHFCCLQGPDLMAENLDSLSSTRWILDLLDTSCAREKKHVTQKPPEKNETSFPFTENIGSYPRCFFLLQLCRVLGVLSRIEIHRNGRGLTWVGSLTLNESKPESFPFELSLFICGFQVYIVVFKKKYL